MKVNRCRHLFSIGGQLLTFIKKFYEGKQSNFGRRIFVFVLPIRNKSPFSGKIITSFKVERMSLDLLAIWPKHKIEMQIIYDYKQVQVWEFVFQGLNIGKWSTGKRCDGVAVVKNVKTIMCQKGGTLPLSRGKRRDAILKNMRQLSFRQPLPTPLPTPPSLSSSRTKREGRGGIGSWMMT